MRPLLVLSPHFDDAVLSCGGLMMREVRAGRRVVVATVFTSARGNEQSSGVRAAEDLEALTMMNAEQMALGFDDAPYRHAEYRSYESIGFGWVPEDDATVEAVRARIESVCEAIDPALIFAPLGIGGHVDHRIVFVASQGLPKDALRFFEERPYLFLPGAGASRLSALGAALPPDLVASRAEIAQGLREAPFLRGFVRDEGERARIERHLWSAIEVPRSGARLQAAKVISLTANEFRDQLAALGCYRSQIAPLLGDLQWFRTACRSHALRLGREAPAVERVWNLS